MLDTLDLAGILRLAISAWILVVLGRSARNAWARRDLMVTIWRGMRPAVLLRALGLFVLVAFVATVLLETVPLLGHGLGSLVSFEGNAVFTPLEEAAGALGPPPDVGPDWALVLLTTAFLGVLLVLLPWLAFIEEEVFRAGTEVLDLPREIWSALKFGLVHLVMLVPVGATLAIAVAGFVYGRTYRRVALDAQGPGAPKPVLHAFRPTRRSREAARARVGDPDDALATFAVESRQAAGVLRAATLHAAFNSLVIVVVWSAITIPALTR